MNSTSIKSVTWVSGFTAWKNYDFGIFIETPVIRIEFEDNDLIENGLGLWTHTFGHGSLSHFTAFLIVLVISNE